MNKNSRILITGCGGMLGEAVYAELKDRYKIFATDIDLNEPWLSYLDVRSRKDVLAVCKKINPDAIIHLAALTDMEYCELNPIHAFDTNFIGTCNMAHAAKSRGIPLIYISTAGIFDGTKKSFTEKDVPNPLSQYAKAKYAGELAAVSTPKSTILRAGWMIGGGPKKDKKFINKIIKQVKAGKKELDVVEDKLGTPTYTYDLAKIIRFVLEKKLYGIYHSACNGGCSRMDVAKQIVSGLELDKMIKLRIVGSDYFSKDYFAPRPPSEELSNSLIRSINTKLVRHWKTCLNEYLNKFNWLA
jgi:dTDP-4-dehydrorhamnose reductase